VVVVTDRELDALIAEKVFSLVPCADPKGNCDGAKTKPCQCWSEPGENYGTELRTYSTEIEDAFGVVAALRAKGYDVGIDLHRAGKATVRIHAAGGYVCSESDEQGRLPRLLCVAALEALRAGVPA
jgi:hypothetical protein